MKLRVNGQEREVASGSSLRQVVASVTLSTAGVAAALDDAVVPQSLWSQTALSEGSRVEILTAVQGG